MFFLLENRNILIEARGLKKYFPVRSSLFSTIGEVKAVDGVDLQIRQGETVGLVGESGCGKSTFARLLLRLVEPTAGRVRFMGRDIFQLDKKELRKIRHEMQMVFQDVKASFNPRKTVRTILKKPFKIYGEKNGIEEKITKLLEDTFLIPAKLYIDRYPHQLSGGERQRLGLARALALRPKFIVADEAVSSLDMSVKVKILNLMKEIKKKYNLTVLFITHELAVAKAICDRVTVMYLGKIVESASAKELFDRPLHPYTQALTSAIYDVNARKKLTPRGFVLKGEPPSPINPPSGCRFHTRCPYSKHICAEKEPDLVDIGKGHLVSCFLLGAQDLNSTRSNARATDNRRGFYKKVRVKKFAWKP